MLLPQQVTVAGSKDYAEVLFINANTQATRASSMESPTLATSYSSLRQPSLSSQSPKLYLAEAPSPPPPPSSLVSAASTDADADSSEDVGGSGAVGPVAAMLSWAGTSVKQLATKLLGGSRCA